MDHLTQMADPENILEIDGLHTDFVTPRGTFPALEGVSLSVPAGEVVGIVGQSGSGKSVTSLSVMGLLPPGGRITGGAIRLNLGALAYDLTKTPEKLFCQLRGGSLSMIFQEPMTALNPVLTVGRQLTECIRLHAPADHPGQRARQLLRQVGFSDPGRILKSYPHNLSGGQRQRICIAMAIAGRPQLMIADEPTTALDVTVQAQVLGLLKKLSRELNMAVLLITHDLSVVAAICRWVAVMYRGQVVEWGTAEQIFRAPKHPYTQKLLQEERP